jgi:hypothetical protein
MTNVIVIAMEACLPHHRPFRLSLGLAFAMALAVSLAACSGIPSTAPISHPGEHAMTFDETKRAIAGSWVSLASEVRPSAQKNADGTLKPFYLKREFKALPQDRFELSLVNSVDAYGQVPLARILIKGHMLWRGDHPIAPGAQKIDFVADEAYEVTPLLQGFADALNPVAVDGYVKWEVKQSQSVFGKAFAPFGLTAGQNFMEFDLVYMSSGLLFWGARHIDGRGFDTEANRPTNLQIPMARR